MKNLSKIIKIEILAKFNRNNKILNGLHYRNNSTSYKYLLIYRPKNHTLFSIPIKRALLSTSELFRSVHLNWFGLQIQWYYYNNYDYKTGNKNPKDN